jgi:hypothetical protein
LSQLSNLARGPFTWSFVNLHHVCTPLVGSYGVFVNAVRRSEKARD